MSHKTMCIFDPASRCSLPGTLASLVLYSRAETYASVIMCSKGSEPHPCVPGPTCPTSSVNVSYCFLRWTVLHTNSAKNQNCQIYLDHKWDLWHIYPSCCYIGCYKAVNLPLECTQLRI